MPRFLFRALRPAEVEAGTLLAKGGFPLFAPVGRGAQELLKHMYDRSDTTGVSTSSDLALVLRKYPSTHVAFINRDVFPAYGIREFPGKPEDREVMIVPLSQQPQTSFPTGIVVEIVEAARAVFLLRNKYHHPI